MQNDKSRSFISITSSRCSNCYFGLLSTTTVFVPHNDTRRYAVFAVAEVDVAGRDLWQVNSVLMSHTRAPIHMPTIKEYVKHLVQFHKPMFVQKTLKIVPYGKREQVHLCV